MLYALPVEAIVFVLMEVGRLKYCQLRLSFLYDGYDGVYVEVGYVG